VLLAFAGYRLDIERRELRRGSEIVNLEPKAFDLLTYLVRHRDRVVSKDDLLQEVWGGRIVSEAALTTRINAVRRALGDDGAAQRLVRTLTRKGIRFVGEVTELPDPVMPVVIHITDPMPLPDKPSIAVMPFGNMSGDPEQEYFVDGMVEEMITALSRIRWLFVVARNSTYTYNGQAIDTKRVGRELGVRYVLEGSVRKSGGRVRITVQLIEAETGAHLWADRFDGSLEDVFDLQDQVAIAVAGVIEPALLGAETARIANRPTTEFSAYDSYLRAYATLFSPGKEIPEALALLEQVIARDPNYGPALACAAMCCSRMIVDGSSGNPAADRRKGADFARRALAVAGDDAVALANAAFALAGFGGDLNSMIAIVDRALILNPSFARGWYISGSLRVMAGDLQSAIAHAETAQRLSPRVHGGVGSSSRLIGAALALSRRFEEAIPRLDDGSGPLHLRWLAACYAHLGRLDEARQVVERLEAMGAVIVPDYPLPYRNPDHRKLFLSGLQLAMGEAE